MGGFSERFSQPTFGFGDRHSEYVSTQSRFFEDTGSRPQTPQWARHGSFFEEPESQPQWAQSGRQSEYVGTESRVPYTTTFFPEPYNQPHWGESGIQSDYTDSRFTGTQSYFGDSIDQTQGETSNFVDQLFGGPEPVTHNFFDTESTWSDLSTYIHQLPRYFQQYVANIKNVRADGNCGFRALAVALGESEERFEWVRELMLQEYESNIGYYQPAFGGEAHKVHTLLQLSFPHGRPLEYWMMIPYCAMLLSNALGVIIVCLSVNENVTCFPFWKGPGQLHRNDPICIGLVSGGSHFVTVSLENNCPLPYPNAWGLDKPASRSWAQHPMYKDRLAEYHRHIQATKRPPGFQAID